MTLENAFTRIDKLRSAGSETLGGSSNFDFRGLQSRFDVLFIQIFNLFEGLENEVTFQNEKELQNASRISSRLRL